MSFGSASQQLATLSSNAKKKDRSARNAEVANLRAKREIIGRLSALTDEAADKDAAIAELRKLQDCWKEIGHVTLPRKDKLYEAYRAAVDAVRDHFAIAESRARRQLLRGVGKTT